MPARGVYRVSQPTSVSRARSRATSAGTWRDCERWKTRSSRAPAAAAPPPAAASPPSYRTQTARTCGPIPGGVEARARHGCDAVLGGQPLGELIVRKLGNVRKVRHHVI